MLHPVGLIGCKVTAFISLLQIFFTALIHNLYREHHEVAVGVGLDAFVVAVADGARGAYDGDARAAHQLRRFVDSLFAPERYGYVAVTS